MQLFVLVAVLVLALVLLAAFALHRPRPRPEPLTSWVRMALYQIDSGALWLDAPRRKARKMLGPSGWKVTDRASLLRLVGPFLATSGDAADGLRAIRLLMVGARVGYLDESEMWNGIAHAASQLMRTHRSFDDLAEAYLRATRGWRQLPLDGSRDDADLELVMRTLRVFEQSQNGWRGVPFVLDLGAAHTGAHRR